MSAGSIGVEGGWGEVPRRGSPDSSFSSPIPETFKPDEVGLKNKGTGTERNGSDLF